MDFCNERKLSRRRKRNRHFEDQSGPGLDRACLKSQAEQFRRCLEHRPESYVEIRVPNLVFLADTPGSYSVQTGLNYKTKIRNFQAPGVRKRL